ncbi:MAG TPA: hypothetical protein VGJ50_05590 [Streptosporangiaceae bacterium]|jgi:hypothetical protein
MKAYIRVRETFVQFLNDDSGHAGLLWTLRALLVGGAGGGILYLATHR